MLQIRIMALWRLLSMRIEANQIKRPLAKAAPYGGTKQMKEILLFLMLSQLAVVVNAQIAHGGVEVKTDCPSIEIVNVSVQEYQELGMPGANLDINLVLRNRGSAPLVGATYAMNKELLLAQHGAGTASAMIQPYGKRDKVLPGRTFQISLTVPIEIVSITIAAASFEGNKNEGDPYMWERMRANMEGIDARAKQLLSLLRPTGTAMTDKEVSKLEAQVRSLPDDVQAPRKFSAKAREEYRNGFRVGKQSILFSIAELKRQIKERNDIGQSLGIAKSERSLKQEDAYQFLRAQVPEVAQ